MQIIEYSEKSIAVFGQDTRDQTLNLKSLGGRYNPNLTHPETKERLSGRIFSKKQKDKVEQFVKTLIPPSDTCKLVVKKSKIKQVILEPSETPEIKTVPEFQMIVPKVGMKVKLVNEEKQEMILDIVLVKTNSDGLVFDFQTKNGSNVIDFVMVGKEWRRISTESPIEMSFA